MSRFQLLKLHCPERVLKYAQVRDLFEVSQLSKPAYDLVLRTSACFRRETHLRVVLAPTTVITLCCEEDQMKWTFYAQRDPTRHNYEGLEERTLLINDETFGALRELVFVEKHLQYYVCESHSFQKLRQFIAYISSLFNARVSFLNIGPYYRSYMEHIVSDETLRTSAHVQFDEGSLSRDEMIQALEGFRSQKMCFIANTEFIHHLNHTISASREFRVWNAWWFDGPLLLKLESRLVTLADCDSVTDDDLNAFLLEWLRRSTGCGRVSMMVLDKSTGPDWDLDNITHNLTRYEQPYPENGFTNGRIYLRESDGQMFKINVHRENLKSYVIFHGNYMFDNPIDPVLED